MVYVLLTPPPRAAKGFIGKRTGGTGGGGGVHDVTMSFRPSVRPSVCHKVFSTTARRIWIKIGTQAHYLRIPPEAFSFFRLTPFYPIYGYYSALAKRGVLMPN